MAQTVVLLHTLPDGSSHFDWLIDQPDLDVEHRLLSFRCPVRPDEAASPFGAEIMPPHRAFYLDYEGPLSGKRGLVRRIASGRTSGLREHDGCFDLTVLWSNGSISYRVAPFPDTVARVWIIPAR